MQSRLAHLFITVVICVACVQRGASANPRLTLQEAYTLAEERSSSLIGAREEIVAANARYDQAFAAVLPSINLIADQRYRNSEEFGRIKVPGGSQEDPAGPTAGRGGTIGRNQFEAVLRVSQPIFSGFRDFLLVSAAEDTIEASKKSAERVRDVLRDSVASVYFQTLTYLSDEKTLIKTNKVLRDRIEELRQFVALGKTRESEVLAAESELYSSIAILTQTQGLLASSREALAFFVGDRGRTDSLEEVSPPLVTPKLELLLERARNRPDIKAARHRVLAQSSTARAISREHIPQISLEGTGFVFEDPDRTRDWDVLFRLNVPLYQGGAITARRNEAESRMRALLAEEEELARSVEQNVRDAMATYESRKAEQRALEALLKAAEKTYQAQRSDYELGVVTNLDVLNSIQRLQDAERRVKAAAIAVALAAEKLEFAAGGAAS